MCLHGKAQSKKKRKSGDLLCSIRFTIFGDGGVEATRFETVSDSLLNVLFIEVHHERWAFLCGKMDRTLR